MIEVNIPEDKGIDIRINMKNYNNANALLVKTSDSTYDLYINITRTTANMIFKDTDTADNLLRVGNNIIVDFQSGSLRGYIPAGNDEIAIQHIYYIDHLSDKIMTMSDSELMNHSGKTLIWGKINF